MALWTDDEWWALNMDQAAALTKFEAAGLSVNHWANRKPIFDAPVDWERIQELLSNATEDPPFEPDPEPTEGTPVVNEPVATPRRKHRKKEQA